MIHTHYWTVRVVLFSPQNQAQQELTVRIKDQTPIRKSTCASVLAMHRVNQVDDVEH